MTSHSFLTALSPIDYRHADPEGRIASVRDTILSHEQAHSPFKACPMAHMVRLQILDNLVPPMGDTTGAHVQTKYLLFVADIDGGIDDFLDCLYRTDPDFVAKVWGKCMGYPAYEGAVFFRRYIAQCSFTGALAYAGFPASVGETLTALKRKNMLADWIGEHEGKSPAELQNAWRRDRARFLNVDTPKPGSL